MRRKSIGMTRVDVLTALACAAVLCAICSFVLGQDAGAQDKAAKDGAQLREIHQALLVFAREFDGIYTRPGLVNRLPDPELNQEIPGRGPEDVTANTTANLYSVLIMANYVGPELIISPLEQNPKVNADRDYNWEKYQPINDVYWDDTFAADLKEGSNVSYAHLVIFGKRIEENWCDSMTSDFAVLGNRGPRDGKPDAKSFTCDEQGNWKGRIVFGDNHLETLSDTAPATHKKRKVDGEEIPDNLFAMEGGATGSDAILSFTQSVNDKGPTLQHD